MCRFSSVRLGSVRFDTLVPYSSVLFVSVWFGLVQFGSAPLPLRVLLTQTNEAKTRQNETNEM